MPCLDTWLRAVDRAFQPAPQVYVSRAYFGSWDSTVQLSTAPWLGLAWMRLVCVCRTRQRTLSDGESASIAYHHFCGWVSSARGLCLSCFPRYD